MEQKQDVERDEQFLTPAEVAAELRISVSSVYYLIRAGDISAVNMAAKPQVQVRAFYRVKRKWLSEFVARRFVAAAPESDGAQCRVRRAHISGPITPRYIRL